ncbi:MAG: DNA-protecting protein DprA [Candidatus Omnitrophica bacterium]|nr:DNA-protecting protein DprA [Candidatus Omnitrophota bacterium]
MAKKGAILLNLLNLTSQKISNILSAFEDIDQIFKADSKRLREIPYLQDKDVEKILSKRTAEMLDRELELITKENIDCLDISDQDYPSLLKEIENPPVVLYLKGNRKILGKFLFAIVGSRKPTSYGLSIAGDFSEKLSKEGIVIVSGLALGIDTIVHRKAIKTGETVAVLGSGLLNIYPRENKDLALEIACSGAVVSEYPLYTSPLRENFPRRNRIVSGMSRGVLVVEAASRSGALITAHSACEQNRDVFAIPGNINSPVSKGTHILIKEGAKLVDCVDDILEELGLVINDTLTGTSELEVASGKL